MSVRRRMVVAANRGPYRHTRTAEGTPKVARSAGGLVTALDPVLRERGGTWVALHEPSAPTAGECNSGYDLAYVPLGPHTRRGYYHGVSNGLLWPLLHSFVPTIRDGEVPWRSYVAANAAFAEEIARQASSGDLVWVHDYHLMLVPSQVRVSVPDARIGWYCHVPWPGPDIFRTLPWRSEVIEGLLGADVLGFHTDEYAMNFLRCVDALTAHRIDFSERTVWVRERPVRAVASPIGIPTADVSALASDPRVAQAATELIEALGGRRLVLGVDRLDYTKGIPERIQAFEKLLEERPTLVDEVVFVQVMVPSRIDVRAYAQLKREVDRLVGKVNSRFARSGRVPIQYLYRNLDPLSLYAHYRAADVALVTPLRDGMNLVALEYVAARTECDGVLVLSEFAGAAHYLHHALMVNPYHCRGLRDAIVAALELGPEEQRRCMEALRLEVAELDVHAWADRFLALLEPVP